MAEAVASGNLDVHSQNTQLRVGVVVVAVGLALAEGMLQLGAPTTLRGLLFLPFFVGTYGVYAGLTRMCGFTALRGQRITESGLKPVCDRAERMTYRNRGLCGIASSLLIAATATALLVFAQ
jgi:hypothetical protein